MTGSAPSRLELERQMRAVSDELAARLPVKLALSIDWDTLPDTEAARYSLSLLIKDIATVLKDVTADELGVSALTSRAKRILITLDTAADMRLHDETLVMAVAFSDGDITALTHMELARRLEKIL